MRKSPIKHIVKAHKRQGKTVYSYNRGHGQNRGERLANPTLFNRSTILQKSRDFREKLIKDFDFLDVKVYKDSKTSDKIQITGHTESDNINKTLDKVKDFAEKTFGKENVLKVYHFESDYGDAYPSINIRLKKGVI